ncbi:MAG: YcgL domain-containing protein [Putridiphycobacter sp.]
MNTFVYRSNKKPGMYLYLVEKDNFSHVPETLLNLMGQLEFSFEFDLSEGRKLVKEEAKEVMRLMKENKYFLQMPPAKDNLKHSGIN